MLSLNVNEKGNKRGKKKKKTVPHSWKARYTISSWASDQWITVFLRDGTWWPVREQDRHLSRSRGARTRTPLTKSDRAGGTRPSAATDSQATWPCGHPMALYPTWKLTVAHRVLKAPSKGRNPLISPGIFIISQAQIWPMPALPHFNRYPVLHPATFNQSPSRKTQSLKTTSTLLSHSLLGSHPLPSETITHIPPCVLSLVWLFYNSMDCSPPGFLWLWNFLGKNTGMCSHSLFQGMFLTQALNPSLLHLLR